VTSRRPGWAIRRLRSGLFIIAIAAIATPLHCGGAFAFRTIPDDSAAAPPYLVRLLSTTPVQPNNEIRALWVVRDALESADAIDRMIDFAVQARFHLLFVQVRGRGDAYYRSSIDPPASDLELPLDDFDPLEYLLIRAHRAGISVHAWVNVFYVWSDPDRGPPPGHVVALHPDWLLSSPQGVRQDARSVKWWQEDGIEGYYLSPALPEVRRYTASVIRDIVEHYPVDGIHLDYVRYPGRGYTFGAETRTAFALEWGVDPLETGPRQRDELAATIGEGAVATIDSVYTAWRVGDVDSMVAAVRAEVGTLPVSAAVVPDAVRARVEKGQDWIEWTRRGWVDFVVPMAYTYSPEEIEERTRYFQRVVPRERVLVGLALFDGRDEQLGESVVGVREAGGLGYALFSYNVLADNPYAAAFIEEALFSDLPPSDTGEGAEEPRQEDEIEQ